MTSCGYISWLYSWQSFPHKYIDINLFIHVVLLYDQVRLSWSTPVHGMVRCVGARRRWRHLMTPVGCDCPLYQPRTRWPDVAASFRQLHASPRSMHEVESLSPNHASSRDRLHCLQRHCHRCTSCCGWSSCCVQAIIFIETANSRPTTVCLEYALARLEQGNASFTST